MALCFESQISRVGFLYPPCIVPFIRQFIILFPGGLTFFKLLWLFEFLLMYQPSSARNKRGRKCQEDFLELETCSTLNLPLHKNNDLFMYGTGQLSDTSFPRGKEVHETLNQELNIRCRQKRALSPTPPRPVELHNEFAIYDENEKSESGNSEPLIRREHLPSSCDSVTTEPSLTHMEDLKSSSVMLNGVIELCDGAGAELSKCTGMANLCSLKVCMKCL